MFQHDLGYFSYKGTSVMEGGRLFKLSRECSLIMKVTMETVKEDILLLLDYNLQLQYVLSKRCDSRTVTLLEREYSKSFCLLIYEIKLIIFCPFKNKKIKPS